MNPDSAVEIDRDARHNPSAAKSMGFCLGVDIAQRCFEGRLACWQRRARAQNDFEISQSDAFAAPGLHLASGIVGLTAESGFSGGSQLLAGRAGPGPNAPPCTAARPLTGNETPRRWLLGPALSPQRLRFFTLLYCLWLHYN